MVANEVKVFFFGGGTVTLKVTRHIFGLYSLKTFNENINVMSEVSIPYYTKSMVDVMFVP